MVCGWGGGVGVGRVGVAGREVEGGAVEGWAAARRRATPSLGRPGGVAEARPIGEVVGVLRGFES